MPTPFTRDAITRPRASKGRESGPRPRTPFQVDLTALVRAWWFVLLHPSVATFDRQRPRATWRMVWLSLAPVALVDALGVLYAVYGLGPSGYSSLPVGPKVHLPQTPLLPLAAFVGSAAQFFVFAGLLFASARLLGGRGDFKTQAYLMVLFWTPLLVASGIVELIPVAGSVLGLLIRSYALVLLVPALAAAHAFSLRRALGAVLLIVACGLLLGSTVLALVWPQLQPLLAK